MSKWQPIETAPKVAETAILVWTGKAIHIATFFLEWKYDSWATHNTDCWVIGGGRVVEPTHWMPLPEPPTESIT